jgi:hypothetical protein
MKEQQVHVRMGEKRAAAISAQRNNPDAAWESRAAGKEMLAQSLEKRISERRALAHYRQAITLGPK